MFNSHFTKHAYIGIVALILYFPLELFASKPPLKLYKSFMADGIDSPKSPIRSPSSPSKWQSTFSKGILNSKKGGKNKVEKLYNLLREQFSREKVVLQKKNRKFTIEEESAVYCALHNTLVEYIEKNKKFPLDELLSLVSEKYKNALKNRKNHKKDDSINSIDKKFNGVTGYLKKVPRVLAWVILDAYFQKKIAEDPFFWGKSSTLVNCFEDLSFPYPNSLQCKNLYEVELGIKKVILSNNNSWAIIKGNDVVFRLLSGGTIYKKTLQAQDISGGKSCPKDIFFDPSGRGLAVVREDGGVELWNVSTETPLAVATVVNKNSHEIITLAMSSLSQKFIAKNGNEKGSYFIKRIALKGKNKNISILDEEPFISKITPVLSPNGRYVAYSSGNKIRVEKACCEMKNEEKQKSAPSSINGFEDFSKKGKNGVSVYYDGLFDRLAFEPQSRYLLFGRCSRHSPEKGYLKIVKFEDNFISPEMSYPGHIFHEAFSADGTSFALVCGDGKEIHLCNLESGSKLKLSGHAGSVTKIAFSFDGLFLYSSSLDKTIIKWSTEDGSVINTLKHTLPVTDFVISGYPPFETLLTKTDDQSIWQWGGDTKEYSMRGYLILKNMVPDKIISFQNNSNIWPLEKATQNKINKEFEQAGLKNKIAGFACKEGSWANDQLNEKNDFTKGFFWLSSGEVED